MKKFLAGLIVGIVMATSVSAMAANQKVKLFVNGREIQFPDAPPQILNGRTMVPARPLAEALGAKVEWDAANGAVMVTSDQTAANSTTVDASAPFVGTLIANGQTITASLSHNEAGDICVPLRTVDEFSEVGSPADVPRDTVMVEIDGIRLGKDQLWTYQGRSFVCAATMRQNLAWQVSWDANSKVLTVSK